MNTVSYIYIYIYIYQDSIIENLLPKLKLEIESKLNKKLLKH